MTNPTQEMFYTIINNENFICNFDLGRSKAKVKVYKANNNDSVDLGRSKEKVLMHKQKDNYYFVLESFGKHVAVLDYFQNILLNAAEKRSYRHMLKFKAFIQQY